MFILETALHIKKDLYFYDLFNIMRDTWQETLVLVYSKSCVKRSLSKRPKIGIQEQLSFNAGQKYGVVWRTEDRLVYFERPE